MEKRTRALVFGVGTWLKKKENDVLARNYEQIFGRHVILSTTRKGMAGGGMARDSYTQSV